MSLINFYYNSPDDFKQTADFKNEDAKRVAKKIFLTIKDLSHDYEEMVFWKYAISDIVKNNKKIHNGNKKYLYDRYIRSIFDIILKDFDLFQKSKDDRIWKYKFNTERYEEALSK